MQAQTRPATFDPHPIVVWELTRSRPPTAASKTFRCRIYAGGRELPESEFELPALVS